MEGRTSQFMVIAAVTSIVAAAAFRFPADDLRLSMWVIFKCGVALCLALALARHNVWIAAGFLLATVSMFYPFYTQRSYLAHEAVFYGCVWLYLIMSFVSVQKLNTLFYAVIVAALLNAAMVYLQIMDLDPVFDAIGGGKVPPAGWMGNQNFAAAMLALAVPAFMVSKKMVWVMLVALIPALIFCKTSGGPITAMVAALVYVYFAHGKKPALQLASAALIGLALFIVFVDAPGTERWEVWVNGAKIAKQHWILGSGIGHWKVIFQHVPLQHTSSWWTTAHNEFLQGWFEMGVLFPIIAAGYLISVIKRASAYTAIPAAGIAAGAVNAFISFPMHIAPTAMIILTWMAAFEILSKGERHNAR